MPKATGDVVKLTGAPGWFDPNACETCAGTGLKLLSVERSVRDDGKRHMSVGFSLKDNCPICDGTGYNPAGRLALAAAQRKTP